MEILTKRELTLADIYGGDHLLRMMSLFPHYIELDSVLKEDAYRRKIVVDLINKVIQIIIKNYDKVFKGEMMDGKMFNEKAEEYLRVERTK
jgi:hypothetical protein